MTVRGERATAWALDAHLEDAAAGIFRSLFVRLASQPKTAERDAYAMDAWRSCSRYHFWRRKVSGADDALIALGLALRVPDPDDPDGSLMVLDDGDDGFEDALAAGAPSEGER